MTVEQIRDVRWWASNWAWSSTLRGMDLQPPVTSDDIAQFADQVAPQLLRAGANSLVIFYGQIARRARRLTLLHSRLLDRRGGDKPSGAAIFKRTKERRREFSEGPRADGHYLRRTPPQDSWPHVDSVRLTVRLLRPTTHECVVAPRRYTFVEKGDGENPRALDRD